MTSCSVLLSVNAIYMRTIFDQADCREGLVVHHFGERIKKQALKDAVSPASSEGS